MKKILIMLLCLTMLFTMVACDGFKGDDSTNLISLTADEDKVSAGKEITFTVSFEKVKAKSLAIRLDYDTDHFELVSSKCKMLVAGEITDFSSEIGSAAFESETELNADVMVFVLKAKKSVDDSVVSCNISLESENGSKTVKEVETTVSVK